MNLLEHFIYLMPKKTLIGADSVHQLGDEFKKFNIKKALIVTDHFMNETGVTLKISEILNCSGISSHIYSEVKPNPTIQQVEDGVREFLSCQCDGIITLGGGSPHDCGKAIKLSIIDGLKVKEVPLAAINTTAGTASEITQFAIITDVSTHSKMSIIDERIIPDIAVDDPLLMIDMPKKLTASTGMDALTHALEAYVSLGRNPITDGTALQAIRLIHEHLQTSYLDGKNLVARSGMVYGQYLAGMAFSNAGLGMTHAIAHQLGGVYNLPHGVCNATLLPYVIKFNSNESYICYGYIAKMLKLCNQSVPDRIATNKLIRYFMQLNKEFELPFTLKELGIKEEDIDLLANMTLSDPSLKRNPRKAGFEDVKQVLVNAYYGKMNFDN